MGKQMSMRELRAALSKIEHELAEHGEIELTRNGKVVAVIANAGLENAPFKGREALRRQLPEWPEGTTRELLSDTRGRY